ncbi:MAG: YitT family protein [Clostridia bacterium]|nr:YitT family protein [Clostridia bacterium]
MLIKENKIQEFIIESIETIVGAFIMAIATSLFLLPNQLSSGGIAGLATICYYFLKIPMGTIILILNIPLFIFSVYKLGKGFFIKSIIGTTTFSIFIDMLDKFNPLTQDRFLACIYGGIIIGLGTAIILKANSSTGGSDLVSVLVREYNPDIRMSNVIIIIDIVIVALNVLFFKEIEIGLYSAIAIYLMGKIIDIIFEGIYFTKLLVIISDKNEEIAEQIGEKVRKGTTGLFGKGMYTNKEKLVLICAASRGDVSKVKQTAKKIDPKSFIIIANAREVVGLGFKK